MKSCMSAAHLHTVRMHAVSLVSVRVSLCVPPTLSAGRKQKTQLLSEKDKSTLHISWTHFLHLKSHIKCLQAVCLNMAGPQ